MILVCIISIIASTFIIEVLAIQNCIRKNEKEIVSRASILTREKSKIHESNKIDELKSNTLPFQVINDEIDKNQTIDTNAYENNMFLKQDLIDNQTIPKEIDEESSDSFYISERYEISKLSNKIFNKFIYFLVSFILIGYLYISLTSNGIIVGNSLITIIPKNFDLNLGESGYQIIVLIFYSLVILISLNNINKLKSFGMIIMLFRIIVIVIIFSLCFYTMGQKTGVAKLQEIPMVNFSNITIMIGNSLFFFMSHHSIPGMVENFYPQKKLNKLLILSYISSLIVMILYGGVSLLTFAHIKDCDCANFPCAIQVI